MRIRDKPTWRYVRVKLAEAARSGNTTDVVVALQIALHLEGVECPPGLTPRRSPRLSISLSNESGKMPNYGFGGPLHDRAIRTRRRQRDRGGHRQRRSPRSGAIALLARRYEPSEPAGDAVRPGPRSQPPQNNADLTRYPVMGSARPRDEALRIATKILQRCRNYCARIEFPSRYGGIQRTNIV